MVNRIILHCARQGPDINYAAGILAHVFSGSVFLVDETGRLLSDLSGQEMACTQLKEYLAAKRALPAYYNLSALLGDGGPRVNESYRLSACPLSGKEKPLSLRRYLHSPLSPLRRGGATGFAPGAPA